MMYEYGDPFVEWEEENASREELPTEEEMPSIDELKETVMKLLQTEFDFTVDDAEEAVTDSVADNPEMWNENADADSLAKFLASDSSDD
jgi:hypothetical protein